MTPRSSSGTPGARWSRSIPIVEWTQQQVDDYIAANGILVNPLVYDGYPSIGCRTCTARVADGADPRSGRWAGTAKTECGIHT